MCRLLFLLVPVVCAVGLTAGANPCKWSGRYHYQQKTHDHTTGNGNNTGKKSLPANARASRSPCRRETGCDASYKYRTADGTCNNLDNPDWGSVNYTYQRLLDPVYEDGLGHIPRLKQTNGDYLPTARDVSAGVHTFDINRYHAQGSVMLMEWGQFLAHDIASTPLDTEDLTEACCSDDLVTGSDLHLHVLLGGPCFPIIISEGDRYFTNVSTRCMEFVRSDPFEDDNGVRQQKSALSAYIDGSNVYGTTDDDMNALRSFSGGKLTVLNDGFLTESSDNYCIPTSDDDYCMEAGDHRVNVYPGLGAVHTIFVRYHNYVADQLATTHTDYDDETLFQEARKIVIAVMQRISYNEYLNLILGPTTMSSYGLSDTWAYNASCSATLYNVFATAAFRFGHSMVPDSLLINGVNISSVDLYNRPYHVLHNLDSLLEGMVTQSAERVDRWYSEGITDQLFEESAQKGFDVAAFNIQRGRDHGLPPYNDWRQFCGLERHASFDDMQSSRAYESTYASVDDVDLYSGGLSEKPTSGSVGETYQCLLARQFQSLRNCDRFWWENEDTNIGFASNRVRNQIKKTRLSHVICLTTGITHIQQNAMKVVSDNNAVQSCADLLAAGTDYSLF